MGKKMLTLIALCAAGISTTGCSSLSSETKAVNQELVVDKQVQPMTRNETIVAIKDCTTSGLRAVVLYGKRKINGFTTEVVVDVTCAPHH